MALRILIRKAGAAFTVHYTGVLDATFDAELSNALKDGGNTDVILQDTAGTTFWARYFFVRQGSLGREP